MKISQCHTITKSQGLTQFRKVMAIAAESPTQSINTLFINMYKFRMLRQAVCTDIRVFIRSINYISRGNNHRGFVMTLRQTQHSL